MDPVAIWTTIGSVAGTILGALGTLIFGWRKQKAEEKDATAKTDITQQEAAHKAELSMNEQALNIYKALFETLRDRMNSVETRLYTVEQQHLECQKENAGLKVKVEMMGNQLKEITKVVPVTPLSTP